ncbi:MAG: ATP synthase F1 subunit gamma [Bacteroidia bacterium]|nr:ATP synthase F1 subunit gamma [Bacteroidia bacterium]MCO5253034.1 ATP synthase F1 subunit gamma [Bacteroidota bacterium]
MGSLKEVRGRIASTISTQQITKAMKLVSATKLRKAQTGIMQMRPYEKALSNILQNLSDSVDDERLSAFFKHKEKNKTLLIVVTSDRGLCGAFNANVIKKVKSLISGSHKALYENKQLEIMPIGKKGYDALKKDANLIFNTNYIGLFQDLNSINANVATDFALQSYLKDEYSTVEVVYNQFKNAATQILVHDRFLPVLIPVSTETTSNNDYIFEPNKIEILQELIPRSLKTKFYRYLLDSFASEHGARMIAMDKATDNAGELLKALRLQYNQARQAAITNEISEIVGGAAALEG